jgi:Copper type II ascorbate-dependent monooxygenase, C-terminal domain
MRKLSWALLLAGCAGIFISSCQNDSAPSGESSFGLMQSRVLNTSCAIGGCHASASDDSFLQHGLVLTAAVAHHNLVDVAPQNEEAKSDGLLRVKPGDAEKSLLYHKLLAAGHHNHGYGSPMPLGLPLLSEGQVEFVRQWIEAGAPEKGQVADPALLDDKTYQPENFESLVSPEAGKGLQVVIPKFTVAPNFEREFFVYKKLGNTEDIFVNRIEIKMRQNSHHFILYDFNDQLPNEFKPALDQVRDIRSPSGVLITANMIHMGFHVFVSGTQTPYFDYQLPEGVAIPFKSGAAIDFNSHYVNKSEEEIEGEVNVNLHTVPASSVKKVAKTLNLANQNLNLPAKQEMLVTKTFLFDKKISILSLTSHTHKLGKKFVIRIKGGVRDGEIVYTSVDWHHPVYLNVDPPIVLNAGEGLTSEIIYNNTTDKTVKFGLTSEEEMGIIFGYYVEN